MEAISAGIPVIATDVGGTREIIKEDMKIKEMKMANAIRSAIGSTAQDADLVAGLIDRSKLILSDDDKLTGIDEQIKTIKESKPFLFKDSNDPSVDDNGEVTPPGGKRNTRDQFADWLNQY